jgi:hypothetical protein
VLVQDGTGLNKPGTIDRIVVQLEPTKVNWEVGVYVTKGTLGSFEVRSC